MRPRTLVVAGAAAVLVLGGVGAAVFEPWRLVTDSTVQEAVPTLSADADAAPGAPAETVAPVAPVGPEPSTPPPAPPGPVELAAGDLVAAEHATDGVVRVLELADGSRFVRFEGLATSDGPDLYVWLTDQPSGGDWGSYDDGRYVALGELTANNGDQNYAVPAGVDLAGLTSVVIWCDRFDVAFGTAPVSL